MAGSSAKIKIDFLVNDKQLNAGFMRAWKKADTFGKRMDLIAGRMQSFGRTMTMSVTAPIVAGFALATKMAIDEQKEMALLSQALKKNAKATDEQVAATERWVTKTQNWSGIADGELRPALAALVRSTKDTGKAQDLLGQAMDISVAKGKPLQTVAEAIAKAYAGNTTALGRLGIRMKDAKGQTLTFEQVMKRASRTFGGAAAKAADTTAGKLAILKAKLADAAEEVGTSLIPMVEKGAEWISKIADGFNRLSPAVKDFAVKAALVAAAIGPTSWMAGSGIKVVLRLADAYKTLAKWAGLAGAAQKTTGGTGGGFTSKGGKVGPVAAGSTALASYAGAVAAALAPIVVSTVLTKTQKYIEGKTGAAATSQQNKSAGGAFYGSSKGYGAGGGKFLADQAEAAAALRENLNKPLMARITMQAQNKTGPAFMQVMRDYQTIKTLTEQGIELKIDPEKPLASLQSIQARLMATGMTSEQAVKMMERVFGKDVVKPLRDSINRLVPTVSAVTAKVKAKHTEMANKLMQKIRMPAPDASSLLSTLQQVYNKLIAIGYSADQAAAAIARAVSAQGHLKAGTGAGGHAVTAKGGVFYGAQTRIIAEDGPEAVVPLTKPREAAKVMADAGLLGSNGSTEVNVYLDSEPIAARVEVRRKQKARRSARTLGLAPA